MYAFECAQENNLLLSDNCMVYYTRSSFGLDTWYVYNPTVVLDLMPPHVAQVHSL